MSEAVKLSERENLLAEWHTVSLSLLSALRLAGNKAFGSLGLTYPQAMILVFVERGYTRPKDLADLLGIVPPAVSTLITHLVKEELLYRDGVDTDGRRVQLRLTPLGFELCFRIRIAWHEHSPIDTSRYVDEQIVALIEAGRLATERNLL